MFQSYQNPLV